MIQLIDGVLLINLHAVQIFFRANALEIGALVLIVSLWSIGGRKK